MNAHLIPGPTLGPSLLGVLLRFRERPVAISGDIKSMFHQICLLPSDKPLLHFLWRSMRQDKPVDVYEWQVLPFGTTCSPCCAIYALQKHARDLPEDCEDIKESVTKAFYVDNCLRSVMDIPTAKELVEKLRSHLRDGGFEIRQWASNVPVVVEDLPSDAKSAHTELWLSQDCADPSEGMLGLIWHCARDTLCYKHRPVEYDFLTLRNVYRVLASQYDPIGFLIPFTTRAKVLLQQLWIKRRQWDDPALPEESDHGHLHGRVNFLLSLPLSCQDCMVLLSWMVIPLGGSCMYFVTPRN